MAVRDIPKLKNLLNHFSSGISLNSFTCKKYLSTANVWVVVFVGTSPRQDACLFYHFVIVSECLWPLADLDAVAKQQSNRECNRSSGVPLSRNQQTDVIICSEEFIF